MHIRTAVTSAMVGTALLSLVAMSAAQAASTTDQWSMSTEDGLSSNISGNAGMLFSGSWSQVGGAVGGAVAFTGAPSYGTAYGSENQNAGSDDFALGEVFTSESIPNGYSGNLIQKGLYSDAGQVKLQLVPDNGGTINCRIKGTAGAKVIGSDVKVDDGRWHTAICWRDGDTIGLTVDGDSRSSDFDPGYVSNNRPVRLGNKASWANWTDQHYGAVDCATYVIGSSALSTAAAKLPC